MMQSRKTKQLLALLHAVGHHHGIPQREGHVF